MVVEDTGQPWHSFIRWQDPILIKEAWCFLILGVVLSVGHWPLGSLGSSGATMELLTGTGLWSVAIFTVIFLILVDLMHRRQHWTSRYPPGPVPWPVLGNLLQVDLDNIPYSLYKSADGLEARGCDQWTKGDAGSAVDLWQGHC